MITVNGANLVKVVNSVLLEVEICPIYSPCDLRKKGLMVPSSFWAMLYCKRIILKSRKDEKNEKRKLLAFMHHFQRMFVMCSEKLQFSPWYEQRNIKITIIADDIYLTSVFHFRSTVTNEALSNTCTYTVKDRGRGWFRLIFFPLCSCSGIHYL